MDLIKNLRTKPPTYEDAVAAADEIERLREALKEIADYQKHGWIDGVTDIARSALQQKDSE